MAKGKNEPAFLATNKGAFALLALVVVLWAIGWLLPGWTADGQDLRGQFGDQFGAINALFSGLALAGVVLAIVHQRDELRLQRDELRLQRADLKLQRRELELTREELAGAREAQEAQLEHNQRVERQRLTLGLAERFSHREMTKPRHSMGELKRASAGAALRRVGSECRPILHFAADVGAMANAGMLDRGLAFATFGPDLIHYCYDMEAIGPEGQDMAWPDDWRNRGELVVRCRKFLQDNSGSTP